MLIRSRAYTIDKPASIYRNGDALTYVASYKYTGFIVHIDNDDTDIIRKLRCIIVRTNVLILNFFQLFFSNFQLPLFRSNCTNLYCSHSWAKFTNYQYSKLRISYKMYRGAFSTLILDAVLVVHANNANIGVVCEQCGT